MESTIAQQNENVFVRHIFDKETGKSLLFRFHEGSSPAQTFGLNWWSGKYISYEDVMRQAVEALCTEQKSALRAQSMLESSEAAQEKAERREVISRRARAVFEEMARIEAPDLDLYQRMEQGKITEAEYRQQQAQIQQQIQAKEEFFSESLKQIRQINKVFDRSNPWIRHYADIEVPEILTKEQVKKWIGRLNVENLKTVELVIPEVYARWKAQLPAAWMEII